MRITFGKAVGIGFIVATAVTAATLAVTFVRGADARIPGVLEIDSRVADGKPTTEFFFNPLAPLALAILIGLLLWLAARLSQRREK
jgi:uncharacterized membrane protein HdeD (DUF308 family)